MSFELLTSIPILLRIASGMVKVLNGSASPADWMGLVDTIVAYVKQFPAALKYVQMVQPWIEKLKQVVTVWQSGGAVPTGVTVSVNDIKGAESLVLLNDAVLDALIADGIMAQNAVVTDDDVLDQA